MEAYHRIYPRPRRRRARRLRLPHRQHFSGGYYRNRCVLLSADARRRGLIEERAGALVAWAGRAAKVTRGIAGDPKAAKPRSIAGPAPGPLITILSPRA